MKKLPVLIVNSYAGSLTLAAKQEGHQIIGSYEDSGYGLEVQKANFPKLDYRSTVAEWPKQDLSGTLVLAHPPCSAFSQQNITKTARGLDAPKFQQTRTVIDYALRNRAAGLAVESVPGACDGAKSAHDELGAKYKYDVFRVLQNACSFGVPQWRPRFWVIYLPRGSRLRLPPVPDDFQSASSVYCERGTENAHDVERWDRQLRMVAKAVGPKWAGRLANGGHGYGSIVRPLQRVLEALGRPAPAYSPRGGNTHEAGSLCATSHAWCCSDHKDSTTTFLCRVARLVDPGDLVGTVLGDAWWVWAGKDTEDGSSRSFYEEEYKLAMGFPATYDFSAVKPRLLRTYLSRGVCPPVARWVLQALQVSVTKSRCPGDTVFAGQTADLRPSRAAVREALGKKVKAV